MPTPLHIPDPTHENASLQEADFEITNGSIENISPDLWDSLSRRYGSYSYAKPAGPWWKFAISPIPKHSIVRPAWKCHDPKWLIPLHWYWSRLTLAGTAATFAHLPNGTIVFIGTSWIEFVTDFEMATRVIFAHHGTTTKKIIAGTAASVRERAAYFAVASRAVLKLCVDPRFPM